MLEAARVWVGAAWWSSASPSVPHATSPAQAANETIRVTVALVLGASERITATADVEVLPPTGDVERRVLVRLRCPTDGGATRMRLDGAGPGTLHGHLG